MQVHQSRLSVYQESPLPGGQHSQDTVSLVGGEGPGQLVGHPKVQALEAGHCLQKGLGCQGAGREACLLQEETWHPGVVHISGN